MQPKLISRQIQLTQLKFFVKPMLRRRTPTMTFNVGRAC